VLGILASRGWNHRLVDLDSHRANLTRLLYHLADKSQIPAQRPAFTARATVWQLVALDLRILRILQPSVPALITLANWYIVPNHRYIVPAILSS